MWIKKLLVAAAAFAGVAFGTGEAQAAFVCQANLVPGTSGYGEEGYVYFSLYTGPSCTGTIVRSYYACTAGATNTVCASNLMYRYERLSLHALFQALHGSAVADLTVGTNLATCVGGGNTCFASAFFFSSN